MRRPAQHPREGAQIRHRTGEPVLHLIARHQPFGPLAQRFGGVPHRLGQRLFAGPRGLGPLLDLVDQAERGLTAIRHLARHQIHGLDAVGALVNGADPRVAGELRGASLLHIAHAAMDLHTLLRHRDTSIGPEGLDDRRQKRGPRGPRRVAGGIGHVGGHGGHQRDGARGVDLCLHPGQHPAHVRVLHDGPRAARLALHPVERIGQRMLIGGLGHADALHADAQPRVVHHREHRRHALVLFTHQPAPGTVVLHHRGGRAVDPHLVL
ncbi:hypothetical protein PARU111607_17700 [Palleronia rufa]